MSFFKRLKETISTKTESVTNKFKEGLAKTRDVFVERVEDLFSRRKKIDEDFYEELEEILIGADVGVNTVLKLIDDLRSEVRKRKIENPGELQPILSEMLIALLKASEQAELKMAENGLTVILFVGVNGVGKTTTIGKMAHRLKSQGKKVLLAAGDTFRAGAIEQLEEWGRRVGVDVIKQQAGSDPAAVMYDALQAAKSRGVDVLLCDTAGRLQNKVNLMEELNKIYRVIRREVPEAPHEVLLVLDATTGQNAMTQAKLFDEKSGLTGLVLTKLDGTAKGGIVVAIRQELKLPVKFVGLGEKMDDLQPFDSDQFVHALFSKWIAESDKDQEQAES
ncbi:MULTISPECIES: signal recognition particle-docking protein FtsY [Paenibacillus]|uniref:Signal recognition particle receptor FtsY n=1 Tax=Paenibacillus naphthalenovorans TaxID=162209 RepID=A0A0U2W2G8_9BACL|nr:MULTISPECIES: signal recognition particle-docking protein FtsY [Paenibacillus]ALS21597.1 signal recognition particle-docking protein FtsY [Paenibacillus naphthalenovorans]NTZ18245.1 signal recognition particle-docking protein FtsY [Paenibacillus sp. JMULE4]GCL71324.1 signal recognition particle-docking protein FtsY [Paenibacillus naphthalenovorans]SDI73598.1 fused signal recognition particle receptor [Paenibacillus naphthalenovorans]